MGAYLRVIEHPLVAAAALAGVSGPRVLDHGSDERRLCRHLAVGNRDRPVAVGFRGELNRNEVRPSDRGHGVKRHGTTNVEVIVGDGSEGVPEHAPYGAILVSAAFPQVPPLLVAQLAENGRLVQPIGRGGDEDVVLFRKRHGAFYRVRTVADARFVRLVGRHGFAA